MGRDPRCDECRGDGRCAECFGTGTNVHLNESEPKCKRCAGAGTCPACKGTGIGAFLWRPNQTPVCCNMGVDLLVWRPRPCSLPTMSWSALPRCSEVPLFSRAREFLSRPCSII